MRLGLPTESGAASIRCAGCQKTFPNPRLEAEGLAAHATAPPVLAALANETPPGTDQLDNGCLFATTALGMFLQAGWVYGVTRWLALPAAANDVLVALGFAATIGTFGTALLMTGSASPTTRTVGRLVLLLFTLQGAIGLLVALLLALVIAFVVFVR